MAVAGSGGAIPNSGRKGRQRPDTPAAGSRRGRPRWAKIAIVVGVALALLATLSLGGVKFLTERLNHALQKADLLDNGARTGDAHLKGPLNYLLIGSDARAANPLFPAYSRCLSARHCPSHSYLGKAETFPGAVGDASSP